MMKIPDENIITRISLRWRGTWSLARIGIGMRIMQRSDLVGWVRALVEWKRAGGELTAR
jgi:hypothetical protein